MSTENRLVDEKPATLAEHIQFIKDATKQVAIVPHAWLDEWLKEAERQEQTIADLRARVEAMQKAGKDLVVYHAMHLPRCKGRDTCTCGRDEAIAHMLFLCKPTTETPTDHGK